MRHTPSSSNQTEIVIVAQTPEEQANLDRFDKLDFEVWNNRNGHFTRDTQPRRTGNGLQWQYNNGF
jgi:hypothetical protein